MEMVVQQCVVQFIWAVVWRCNLSICVGSVSQEGFIMGGNPLHSAEILASLSLSSFAGQGNAGPTKAAAASSRRMLLRIACCCNGGADAAAAAVATQWLTACRCRTEPLRLSFLCMRCMLAACYCIPEGS
jgi:hypothetical protein